MDTTANNGADNFQAHTAANNSTFILQFCPYPQGFTNCTNVTPIATGATDFVTACPFCYQGLSVGIIAEEAPIRMRDITEIIMLALGGSDKGL